MARQSRPALSLGLDREGRPLARTARLREGGDGRRSLRASCVAGAAPASAGRGRVSRGPVTSGTRSAAPGLSTSEVASAGTWPLADRTHAQASGHGGSLRKQKPDSNARLPRVARAGDTGAAGGGQRPAVLFPTQRPPAPRVLDAATKPSRAVLPKPPERQRLRPREAPPSVGHTRHV